MTTEATDQPQEPDLKVVIALKGGGGFIGIQRSGCDPVLVPIVDFGLQEALAQVPGVVAQAEAQWQTQRQYPQYERPAPPRPAATTRPRPAPKPGATTPKPAPTGVAPKLF